MTQIFVNFPTTDVNRSKEFYTSLGVEIVLEFSDENATCLKWGEGIFFMILTREYLGTFTDKPIADPHSTAQVLTALSRESRDDVESKWAKVLDGGVSEDKEPQDYGFMYSISMADPEGNFLEFMWIDPEAAEKAPEAFAAEQN